MVVAGGLSGARDHVSISLLALNGLRVPEAIGADIEPLGLERSHRTLTVVRKGAKTVTLPLAPRSARAVDLAVGERCDLHRPCLHRWRLALNDLARPGIPPPGYRDSHLPGLDPPAPAPEEKH